MSDGSAHERSPMASGMTLPQLLLRNAERTPDRPALREKDRGIWQTYTWRRYCDEVRDFALGLAAHGFGRGDKLSVIGENRPRLYFAQLAAMSLGGIAVPVYQDAIASELAYVLDHAETSVVVAEDQEQVDKILALRDELPHLKLLVYDDPRGLRNYDEPLLASFEEVQAAGRRIRRRQSRFLRGRARRRQTGRSGAVLLYLGHDLAPERGDAVARQSAQRRPKGFAAAEAIRPERRAPVRICRWPGSAIRCSRWRCISGSGSPAIFRSGRRPSRAICASSGRPWRLAPPRYWENTLTAITVRAADSGWLKRSLFQHFRAVAERAESCEAEGRPVPAGLRLQRAIGEVAGLRAAARSARAAPRPARLYRRRAARPRHVPLLPRRSVST